MSPSVPQSDNSLGSPGPHALRPWRHNLTDLLARPAFRRLWLYTIASSFTRWMEIIITGWLAFQLTGSPWLVSLTGVGRGVAGLLMGPFGGALADRFDRGLLLRIAEGGNLVALILLAGAATTNHSSYALLLLTMVWFGISMALALPAQQALLMDVAGSKYLLPAVVLERVTQSLTRVIGPLLAGILLALWQDSSYTVLLLFSTLSLLALRNLHGMIGRSGTLPIPVWKQLSNGYSYVRSKPIIWAVLVMNLIMNCFVYPTKHLHPVFAEDILRVGPIWLGMMGAANGVGAPLMLLISPHLKNARSFIWTLVVGAVAGSLALTAFAASTHAPLAIALLTLSGLGQAAFDVMRSTLILSEAQPALRGRSMGLLVLTTGGFPLGALATGAVAEHWGAPVAIGASSLICAIMLAVVVLRSSLLTDTNNRDVSK